jgi:hypothetical protein
MTAPARSSSDHIEADAKALERMARRARKDGYDEIGDWCEEAARQIRGKPLLLVARVLSRCGSP